MDNAVINEKSPRFTDWMVSLAVAAVALLAFSVSCVDCAAAGIEDDIIASWSGLTVQNYSPFPLAGFFAKMFGMTAFFTPLVGALAAIVIFHIVNAFLRQSFGDHISNGDKLLAGRIGGASAALVFVFTPCVVDAASHLGPSLFDALWALLAIAVFIPYANAPKAVSWLIPFASGALLVLGCADTVSFMFLIPFCGALSWVVASKRGDTGYVATGLFLFGFIVFMPLALALIGGFEGFHEAQKVLIKDEMSSSLWFCAPLFAVLPFIISIFSCNTVFRSEKSGGIIIWVFHFIMSVVAVLAVASPISVSSVLGYSGYQPVIVASMAAAMSGCLLAYWWCLTRTRAPAAPTPENPGSVTGSARAVGFTGGVGLAFVMVLAMIINVFVDVDLDNVKSSDEISRRVVAAMGDRTWLITDGVIDDGVLIAAHREGKKINLISLTREKDKKYLENLADKVLAEKLGGEKVSKELAEILVKDYGVERQRLLPFIEHWFKSDPDVAAKVAVWGAPHLWMNVDRGPRPELYFFGCEEEGKGPGDWVAAWGDVKQYLDVPEGWGSYRAGPYDNKRLVRQIERTRRNLRRHIGLLATAQGNFHHFNGLKLLENGKKSEAEAEFEKAFALYELVLNEIDPDNLAALINEELLASKNGFKKALDKHKAIKSALENVYKDTQRRYDPVHLSLLYGTICDAEFMLRYGQALMSRRGQYGHAMFQIRRAIDLIPSEQRKLAELNILAHYFSEGSEAHKAKARNIYMEELQKDPGNRQALMRLSNLEALEGNVEKAIDYLERAVKGVEKDTAYGKQVAQLHLLKNDLRGAETVLRATIDATPADIHAWALLTHVIIRDIDNMGEVKEGSKRAERRKALFNEVEGEILPAMAVLAKDNASNDAVYQSTRALVLMRKGGVENIREARDSFEEVSKSRRGSSRTGDMILSLDMQLDDKEHAEEKARTILIDNPSDPLANYIMGSLLLQRGDNETAEKHLRRAVDTKRQVPLAFNDLAEVLRRRDAFDEAEKYARKAVEAMPKLYVVWETLGSILMDAGKNFEEAEQHIQKACDLSKDAKGGAADVRMLISLARVQIKRGEMLRAKGTMRVVLGRINELTEFEKKEFEEMRKSVK